MGMATSLIRTVLMTSLCSLQLAAAPADSLAEGVAAVRATDGERRWRLIPFGDSLAAALKEGQERNRPIYFFGGDGVLDSGNC